MNFLDLANLLDNDGNMQNEMMVMAFAATLLSTIPVLLGNEFDINVGLKKKRKKREALLQVRMFSNFDLEKFLAYRRELFFLDQINWLKGPSIKDIRCLGR